MTTYTADQVREALELAADGAYTAVQKQKLLWLAENYARMAADAERYRWLRDASVPPHNFYISVPIEFDGVRYTPVEVDAYIDAAIDSGKEKP